MDVHPIKNGINRYWSIPIWLNAITRILISQSCIPLSFTSSRVAPTRQFLNAYGGSELSFFMGRMMIKLVQSWEITNLITSGIITANHLQIWFTSGIWDPMFGGGSSKGASHNFGKVQITGGPASPQHDLQLHCHPSWQAGSLRNSKTATSLKLIETTEATLHFRHFPTNGCTKSHPATELTPLDPINCSPAPLGATCDPQGGVLRPDPTAGVATALSNSWNRLGMGRASPLSLKSHF